MKTRSISFGSAGFTRPRAARRGGFTLLELLIASSLMAVVALTLYTGMTTGFRARTSARAQMEVVREATIAMELIQKDLQSLLPPRGVLAGPFVGHAMGTAGTEADSLQFHTLGRDFDDTASVFAEGMRRVELALRSDDVLVRRVERNLLAPVQGDRTEEVLARDVHAFAVRYFNGYGWLAEWDSTLRDDMLPLAVEITLELKRPSPVDRERRYRITQLMPISCGRATEIDEELGVLLE